VAKVAAANAKLRQGGSSSVNPNGGEGKWGKLSSGVWGRLDQEQSGINDDTGHPQGVGTDGFAESHMDSPLALMDVDDTLPLFRSILAHED
jgi:hypothetical protein